MPKLFTPSISIERPVVWKDEASEKAYWKGIHKAMGKTLTRNLKQKQHPQPPRGLSVVQLRENVLRDAAVDMVSHHERQELMERLAGCLQERLCLLLKDTPAQLALPLGELACFSDRPVSSSTSAKRQLIGMEPSDWRGFKAKYPVCDEAGVVTTNRQLALEGLLYRKAISDTHSWFEPKGMVADPRIVIIKNPAPVEISQDSLRDFGSMLAKDKGFPDTLLLDDPILTLKMGPALDEAIILPVRQLADLDMPKAA